MARTLQFRRGDTATSNAFTGAIAELFVDTEANDLILHDGVTSGGIRIAKSEETPETLTDLGVVDGVAGQVLSTDGAGNYTFTDSVTEETDPIFTAWDKSTGISITESQISDFGDYQPLLVSGTNIKTINGTSVLGTGDLVIDVATDLTDLGIVDGTNGQVLTTDGAGAFTFETIVTEETDPIFTAWDKSTGISITESQISDLGNYQEELVSGTNIKTINGTSVLGTGDIVISGGDADTLGGQLPSYYLDYTNFTNTPTMPTVNDTEITISGTDGLGGTGAFTTNQGTIETISLTNTDKGSTQNIYKNVAVSGQPTLTAGSNNDTLTIVGGANITLTTNGTTGEITIDGADPGETITYTAGTGLTLAGTTFNHTNSITAGSAEEGGVTRTLAYGDSFNIPSVTYDSEGHISSTGTIALTLPTDSDTTYSAGDGISLAGTTFSLTSVTAGDTTTGAVYYNGTTKVAGQFDGGTTDPTNTTRLNYDGNFHANAFYGDGSNLTGISTGETYTAGDGITLAGTTFSLTSITAGDITTGAIYYNGTTKVAGQFDGGTVAPTNTNRLNYDGNFYATAFYGDGSNLTGISTGETYTAGTGLSLSGTTFNHTNSIVAGSAEEGGVTRTLSHGGSFNIPSVTYDSEGHIASVGSVALTLPSDSNTTYTAGDGLTLTGTEFTLTSVTAGDTTTGAIYYNGTTKVAGQFDGGTTDPTNTTRLNYDGNFHATNFYGDGSNLTGITSGATLTDDTATDTTQYLGMARTTTGAWTEAYTSSTKLYFNPSTGTLNSTEFNSLSDINFKTDVIQITEATDKINQIEGVEFSWKDNNNKSAGVIAQQLEEILPHLVSTNDDGVKSVNYDGIIGYLIESVKELSAKVEQLENK